MSFPTRFGQALTHTFHIAVRVDMGNGTFQRFLHEHEVLRHARAIPHRVTPAIFSDPSNDSLMREDIWHVLGLPCGVISSEGPEALGKQGQHRLGKI